MYEVMLDGNEFMITVKAEGLTQFFKKSRSTSKPTKTTTNKRFVDVQSDEIPNFVNQHKNRNTLSIIFYDLKLLTSFSYQDTTIDEHRPICEIPQKELCTLLRASFCQLESRQQLLRAKYFTCARVQLTSKQCQGLGNLQNRSDAVTDEDIEKL